MPAGQPTKYTIEKALKVCELTASSSKSLATICKELDLKYGSVRQWMKDNPEFSSMYAHAKEDQADYLAEEILSIADDGSNDYMTIEKGDQSYNVENKEVTNRSRLRVDSRKWIASKLKPKRYADKIDIDVTSTNTGELIIKGQKFADKN
jgi:hypothetical protein